MCDMGLVPITLMGYRCERCGYEWVPRSTTEVPRVCSRCKSPYWNRPRQKRAEAVPKDDQAREAQENV
jgi:predicted Zn-ribbon and HTH transcriptional regulator